MTPASVPLHSALNEATPMNDSERMSTPVMPSSSDANCYSPYSHPAPSSSYIDSPTGSQSASVGSSFSTQHTARTVYLGNVPPETLMSDILDQVHSGVIESIRPLSEKNCVFVTFVDPASAAHFYRQSLTKHIAVHGTDLKVGWGKPSPPSGNTQALFQSGVTRNVFLGSLDDEVDEQSIRDALSRFGDIEHLRLIREKNIAFAHFLSIADARKCVSQLQNEPDWQARRVNFGKDRCAPSKMYTYPQPQATYAMHYGAPLPLDPYGNGLNTSSATTDTMYPAASMYPVNMAAATVPPPLAGVADRTIYLGNIHPDASCEDICNVIRGGMLSQIRYMVDKHIAFVTFVDPALALQVYSHASFHGLVIKNRRLKVGWGKPTGLPAAVVVAVQNGGSRNVYLGNMDETMTEEKLRHDFSEYGDVELVNTLKEKNCAFVNFTSIAAAMRAIEGIRFKNEYKKFRINYGKDRCGNPPRPHKSVSSPNTGSHRTESVPTDSIFQDQDQNQNQDEDEEDATQPPSPEKEVSSDTSVSLTVKEEKKEEKAETTRYLH